MTSKIVVNNIEADAGVSTVTFNSNVERGSSNLHSTGLNVSDTFLHSTGLNVGTGATIHQPADNVMTLGTNGSERLRISSDGNVGIGTDNPSADYRVTIKSSTSPHSALLLDTTESNYNTNLYFAKQGTNKWIIGNKADSDSFRFVAGSTERLRIGSSGQLGIGGANYGTAGQFLQSQGASSAVQWASVSSDLQFAQWRVTSLFGGGNVDPITNWSQTDANATLTESSGIFSFPSTGYWEIMMQMYGYKNTDNDNIELHIMTTTNNSSYTTRSHAYSHMNNDDGGNLYVSIRASLIFDVTNTSTHKIKFKTINNTVNWAADSGRNDSYAIFKRLAAT